MNKNYWLVIAFVYFCLFLFHLIQIFRKIKEIENNAKIKSFNGINLGIHESITDINSFINTLNRDNRKINIITSVSYSVAIIVSIISYFQS